MEICEPLYKWIIVGNDQRMIKIIILIVSYYKSNSYDATKHFQFLRFRNIFAYISIIINDFGGF